MKVVPDNESNNHIAYDIENPCPLVSSIEKKLVKLSPPSSECCIYRVPPRLRKQNEMAYTPQVVSIGPIHHGKEHLEVMQEQKLRTLKVFLEQTNMSLEDAVKFVKEREVRLRNSFAGPFDQFTSDEFIEIILLDAIFVLVILCCQWLLKTTTEEEGNYLRYVVLPDMLMLENQLPFFILVDLLAEAKKKAEELKLSVSISKLLNDYLSVVFLVEGEDVHFKETDNSSDTKHIIDFIKSFHLPDKPSNRERKKFHNSNNTLTELHEAGVEFKASSSKNLIGINFDKNKGVLEIPKIKIDDSTESLLRNIIAFEQSHLKDQFIADYILLMDSLIDTPKDIELLVKCKVIENNLGDTQQVATLFNNLTKEVVYILDKFYFSDICEELNNYSNVQCHQWMANLKHEYFKNPWKVLSLFAAVILLILTVIQTTCSIISLP